MINSYNSAILFGALEFVKNFVSRFFLISRQKYSWFGNPDKIFVRRLPRKNKQIFFGFGVWNMTSIAPILWLTGQQTNRLSEQLFINLKFLRPFRWIFTLSCPLFLPHFFFFSFIQSLSLVSFDKGTSSHKCTRTFSTIQKDNKKFVMDAYIILWSILNNTYVCRLLEVKLPYESICPSVGWSVCHIFLSGTSMLISEHLLRISDGV